MSHIEVPVIPAHMPSAQLAGATLRVCLVTIGTELFAIDLRYVREVFPVEHTTPVPKMPAVIVGVANLRGTIMPLVDVRSALGLGGTVSDEQFAVVIRHGAQQVGLIVDEVPEIRTVSRDEVLASPSQPDRAARPFISGILPVEGRMGGMVEVPALLARVEGG
ncbi:chemotaxis protein CheW [Nitrospira sp.]|nr:chemotaxis protein CheW [Nitrospira sp.]